MNCTSLAFLAVLALSLMPALAHAAKVTTPSTPAAGGVRIALTIAGAAVKTGDRATVTATVTNTTDQPLDRATLLLGLVDMTPGQPVPLGLETWTSDPESVALPPLAPGASAAATWHLVMIQPGPLGLYASVLPGPTGPIESSPVTVLSIRETRVLNPSNVLPVAIGVPLGMVGLLTAVRGRRRRYTLAASLSQSR